jgi:hypothetical protein
MIQSLKKEVQGRKPSTTASPIPVIQARPEKESQEAHHQAQ